MVVKCPFNGYDEPNTAWGGLSAENMVNRMDCTSWLFPVGLHP